MREHRHLGVYGIIICDGKILLTKKSRGAYTGRFDLPGGGLEHGENILDCLAREIKEETGLEIACSNLHDVYSYNVRWNDLDEVEDLHHVGIIYDVDVADFESLRLTGDGEDVLSVCWKNIDEVDKEHLSPFAYRIIKELSCVKK